MLLVFGVAEAQDDEVTEVRDEALIGRLRDDVLEASGRLRKTVAESLVEPLVEELYVMKSKQQKLSITCLAIASDDKHIFTGSKDCSIVKCK